MPRSTSRSTAANHNAGARKKPFLPELAVVSCKFPNFSAFTQQPLNSYDSSQSCQSCPQEFAKSTTRPSHLSISVEVQCPILWCQQVLCPQILPRFSTLEWQHISFHGCQTWVSEPMEFVDPAHPKRPPVVPAAVKRSTWQCHDSQNMLAQRAASSSIQTEFQKSQKA